MPRCNAPFRLPTPSSVLEEHRLDPARHRRDAFRSGEPALDEYLRRYAAQQSSKGVTVVHVLVDSSAPQDVLGYYTLGAAELHVGRLAPQDANRLPRYPVPCFRMGRLAVAADRRGQAQAAAGLHRGVQRQQAGGLGGVAYLHGGQGGRQRVGGLGGGGTGQRGQGERAGALAYVDTEHA